MKKHNIMPNVDGCILWHIVNFTPDMPKYKAILVFQQAFERWQVKFDALPPVGRYITFKPTSVYDDAHIHLMFLEPAKSEHTILREDGVTMQFTHRWPFDNMGGVVAHVPFDKNDIYFDEGENWADMFRWEGDTLYVPLLETVLHELGHCFDLDHTKSPSDIMFPTTDEVSRDITDDSFQGLIAAGWAKKKEAFFKAPPVPVIISTPTPMDPQFKVVHMQGKLPKGEKPYNKRNLSAISQIVVHHSADNGTIESIARYHTTPPPAGHGWPGIGYTFVIDQAGTIYQVNDLDDLCFNVAQQNTKSLGICLIGDYQKNTPPDIQVSALKWLISTVRNVLDNALPVVGHRDRVNTTCPGDNLYALLNQLQ